MSAYAEYSNVPFTDREALVEALLMLHPHWKREQITVSEANSIPLYGWKGKNRSQSTGLNRAALCEISIPGRGHPTLPNIVGGASNDIGFTRNAEGQLVPIISDNESYSFNECWINKVKATYLEVLITRKAKKQGYRVKKTEEKGKVKLSLTRWK